MPVTKKTDNNLKHLATVFGDTRRFLGISLETLAEKSGVSTTTIHAIELCAFRQQKVNPSLNTLGLIAKALELSITITVKPIKYGS